MLTYNWCDSTAYNCYCKADPFVILRLDVKYPKAPKKLGRKRRYNDSTIPPLDFRLCPKSPV